MGQRAQKEKSVFFLCRGRERSKSADVRTSPTLTTQGDTGPSQYSRHPPPTMHHASLRKPPEAPHSAWPTLPLPAPRRPAADRTRGGAPGRQRRRHRSSARAAAPPGRRTRSRAIWSSVRATARMRRRPKLRPVSHTNGRAGEVSRGMPCEGGVHERGERRSMIATHRAGAAHLFRRVAAPTSEILSAESANRGCRETGWLPTRRALYRHKSGPKWCTEHMWGCAPP